MSTMDNSKDGAHNSAKKNGEADGKGKSSNSAKSKKSNVKISSVSPSTSQPPLPTDPPKSKPPLPPMPLPAPSGTIPRIQTNGEQRLDKMEEMLNIQWESNQQFQHVVMSALSMEPEGYEYGYGEYEEEDETDEQNAQGSAAVVLNQENSNKENENETFGSFIDRFTGTAGTGSPVSEGLADSLKFMLSEKLDEKVLTEVMDLYEIPVNCAELRVPKVNATIWKSVSSKTRSYDLKMERIQKCLVKGLIALTKNMDNPTAPQQDALACLASGFFESNMLRREMIKPELNPKYAHLCKPSIIVTEQLFGDDLSRQIKDLDEAQKATGQMMKQRMPFFKKQRYNPYGNFRGRGRGRGNIRMPFLGGGQPYQGPQPWGKKGRGRGNRPRFNTPYQPQLQQQPQVQIQPQQ